MRVPELSCWRSAGLQFHVVSLDSSHPLDPAQADTPTARAAVRNARIRDLPEVRQSQNDYDKKEGSSSEKLTVCRCRSSLPHWHHFMVRFPLLVWVAGVPQDKPAEKDAVNRENGESACPHPVHEPGDDAIRHDERNHKSDCQHDPRVRVAGHRPDSAGLAVMRM